MATTPNNSIVQLTPDNKAKSSDYYTLQYIVEQYMLFRGEQTMHNYAKFYQMAVKGFKEINYDAFGAIKTCVIKPTIIGGEVQTNDGKPNNGPMLSYVDFPCDYVNYQRIGKLSHHNKVKWLGLNPELIVTRCGQFLRGNGMSGHSFGYLDGYYSSGYGNGSDDSYSYGTPYGLGGGNNVHGYYNIDTDNSRILFEGHVSNDIVLEYISNGTNEDGEIFAHVYTESAITAFVHWKSVQYNIRVAAVEKQMAKDEFFREKKLVIARNNAFTKDEFLQSIRKNNVATAKF